MLCKNHKRQMRGSGPIISPSCGGNEATKRITIIYHKNLNGSDNSNSYEMCDVCTKRLKDDAESHGYNVEIQDLSSRSGAFSR